MVDPAAEPEVTGRPRAARLVDARNAPGQVAADIAADEAIAGARELGICAVGVVFGDATSHGQQQGEREVSRRLRQDAGGVAHTHAEAPRSIEVDVVVAGGDVCDEPQPVAGGEHTFVDDVGQLRHEHVGLRGEHGQVGTRIRTDHVESRTDAPEGNYLAPAVLDGVRPDMTVAREEVFGPVLSVMRVSSTEEAIEIANDTEYGLAASVFSADIGAALRFANSMDVGMVHINHGTASQAHVPFGGVGGSGLGPYSIGHVAQEFFTKMKVVYVAA
ncbi:hypothetical protein CJ026_026280 [Ralstonia pickettii]|uniref:aldehyde dehydrogenase family protein n=1 Tax=Ralstonia pickettii TaxID=329 RepID=UPI000CD568C9|nr:aldehyde dehydrogenase family protein [Ralstonia pickettii]POH85141.1 hypothetical protein CJ026_026280 [Ralstonia pickettii]